MLDLIKELKKEHMQIAQALNGVNDIGINSHEGQIKLLQKKELILEHLKRADEQLFPILRKEAEHKKELKSKLELYSNKFNSVTTEALEFFNKYSDRNSNIMFIGEFIALFTALKARIQYEEEILFGEYEKVIN